MSLMMERYLRRAGISTPMGRVLDEATARPIRESNDKIAHDVMQLYHTGEGRDWDMGDVDDAIDKFLPKGSPGHGLDGQIKAMDAHEAAQMWQTILPLKKELEDQLDPDDVEDGDCVEFDGHGKLYVLDTRDHARYFWVTHVEKDRFDKHARGNTILKSLAKKIVQSADDVDPEDYEVDESRSITALGIQIMEDDNEGAWPELERQKKYILILRRTAPSRYAFTLLNPQGGSGGMGSFPSQKAAQQMAIGRGLDKLAMDFIAKHQGGKVPVYFEDWDFEASEPKPLKHMGDVKPGPA